MLLAFGIHRGDTAWRVAGSAAPGYTRVYYVRRGEVIYRDARRKLTLKPEYLYIFPACVRYDMEQNPDNILHCTFLHLEHPGLTRESVTELKVEQGGLIYHLLHLFEKTVESQDDTLIRYTAEILEEQCLRLSGYAPPPAAVEQAVGYIANNLHLPLTVADISGMLGYNRQYFIRLFKKYTGVSPYQYIIELRLLKAAGLLRAGHSVTATAAETGFPELKAFCRAFKKRYNETPGEYKRSGKLQI